MRPIGRSPLPRRTPLAGAPETEKETRGECVNSSLLLRVLTTRFQTEHRRAAGLSRLWVSCVRTCQGHRAGRLHACVWAVEEAAAACVRGCGKGRERWPLIICTLWVVRPGCAFWSRPAGSPYLTRKQRPLWKSLHTGWLTASRRLESACA